VNPSILILADIPSLHLTPELVAIVVTGVSLAADAIRRWKRETKVAEAATTVRQETTEQTVMLKELKNDQHEMRQEVRQVNEHLLNSISENRDSRRAQDIRLSAIEDTVKSHSGDIKSVIRRVGEVEKEVSLIRQAGAMRRTDNKHVDSPVDGE